jgi:hypothetical protein
MTFTCLRSRWRSVHYLETKDEALLALQAFLIFVKKVTDVSVALVIRSDNESVFVQGKFKAFCNLHRIRQETCAPYQHWGNGHAEPSFNVTFAAARPMMFTSDFNRSHWPLATSHSVWLQNRLPNKGNGWRIPYDEVFGKLPDLSFARVFGSQAYAFVDPPCARSWRRGPRTCCTLGTKNTAPTTCSSTPQTTTSTSPASR